MDHSKLPFALFVLLAAIQVTLGDQGIDVRPFRNEQNTNDSAANYEIMKHTSNNHQDISSVKLKLHNERKNPPRKFKVHRHSTLKTPLLKHSPLRVKSRLEKNIDKNREIHFRRAFEQNGLSSVPIEMFKSNKKSQLPLAVKSSPMQQSGTTYSQLPNQEQLPSRATNSKSQPWVENSQPINQGSSPSWAGNSQHQNHGQDQLWTGNSQPPNHGPFPSGDGNSRPQNLGQSPPLNRGPPNPSGDSSHVDHSHEVNSLLNNFFKNYPMHKSPVAPGPMYENYRRSMTSESNSNQNQNVTQSSDTNRRSLLEMLSPFLSQIPFLSNRKMAIDDNDDSQSESLANQVELDNANSRRGLVENVGNIVQNIGSGVDMISKMPDTVKNVFNFGKKIFDFVKDIFDKYPIGKMIQSFLEWIPKAFDFFKNLVQNAKKLVKVLYDAGKIIFNTIKKIIKSLPEIMSNIKNFIDNLPQFILNAHYFIQKLFHSILILISGIAHIIGDILAFIGHVLIAPFKFFSDVLVKGVGKISHLILSPIRAVHYMFAGVILPALRLFGRSLLNFLHHFVLHPLSVMRKLLREFLIHVVFGPIRFIKALLYEIFVEPFQTIFPYFSPHRIIHEQPNILDSGNNRAIYIIK